MIFCVASHRAIPRVLRWAFALPRLALLLVLLMSLLLAETAHAQPRAPWYPGSPDSGHARDETDDAGDTDEVARRASNRINMRLGTASTDHTGRPTVCLEITAVWRLSVEGCGTGSGFLHRESGAELAHFRAKARVYQRAVQRGLLRVQTGVGFAELQLDADEAGFEFGTPTGRRIEAAGPEAALSVQWLRPLSRGWEIVLGTSAGAAWIPHAADLAEPQAELQPFVSFEAGIGW